jgi:peptide/nickel transport system permease protein
MRYVRIIAMTLLSVIFGAALLAPTLAPSDYAMQFREAPNSPPSTRFLLGTDELGRDRLSRVLFASRVSLLLAPAAAAISTLFAGVIGTVVGYLGGIVEKVMMAAVDLFMSLPWLFLLITIRAMLPLDLAPVVSVIVTFTLLGFLGWAASARVVCAGARTLRSSMFMLNARGLGCRSWRLIAFQLLPNLRLVLWAQFLISIPVFVLAEANLGMLGLGVTEPLPSLGGLMRELENLPTVPLQPWRLVPIAVLAACVSAFQIIVSGYEVEV